MGENSTPKIIIGTTPTIRITLADGVSFSDEEQRLATITQGSRVKVIPSERISIDESDRILISLVQDDTIRFTEGDVTLQLNWVYEDETRGAICQIDMELLDNDYRKVMRYEL